MTEQAQAVLTRVVVPWTTRVHASVYHEAGSYWLQVQCQAINVNTNVIAEQTGQARYQSFTQALDILDTGIFTLTTERGFTMDIYNVSDESTKATQAEPASDEDWLPYNPLYPNL